MKKKIRWGIMGAGSILHRWMRGAVQLPDTEIAAVSSRHIETARAAAEKWGIPRVLTYEEMVRDPDIDMIYVCPPHTAHLELALMAMEAGKPVLVEKPAAINAAEFRQMMKSARRNNVFLMEAVWTRFFPATKRALAEIEAGRIGEIRNVELTFSFSVGEGDRSRLTDPNRGGGALLDTGVYNLHMAHMLYGKFPLRISGTATIQSEKYGYPVDEQAAYVAQYDGGELAVMVSGITTETFHTAFIYGTRGSMVIPVFWKPTRLEITDADGTEIIEEPVHQRVDGIEDEGYQYEISYVNACLREGLKEAPLMPWSTTLGVLEQTDQLRSDWGLVYPQEGSDTEKGNEI